MKQMTGAEPQAVQDKKEPAVSLSQAALWGCTTVNGGGGFNGMEQEKAGSYPTASQMTPH